MDIHIAGRNREVRNPKTLNRERMQEMENPSILVGEREEEMESPNSMFGEGKEAVENPDSLVRERNGEIGSPKDPTTLVVREMRRETDTPPADDCCPICFGSFTIACKTNCGHWYCGNCILQYWNYSAAPSLQRCKCPICTCLINKLTPAASLTQQEEEVIKVLKNVESYNHLFVGGIHGFNQKVLQLPLVMKRMFLGLMDPSRLRLNYYLMRHLALLLSLLYEMGNFNFIPLGRKEILKFFDYCAIALVIVLCLVGFCRKQLLRRRVRLLAAAQQ
ncbi:uncharacterized protein LOC132300465 isoform X2 [Cornus florida]|uniref:uncharacterized protein LOC132300465 isoform X2 n=1 Tax=Cornus florida TaxID=4283 RepID=UPI00289B086C|nr:uncharacterized protein LOC132300465 isoform X2 [Cornus florida]